MCHIKAHRYRCGHIESATMSFCRVTYANPTRTYVLCRSEPSITISHKSTCRNCQYNKFTADWEARIAEAHQKRQAAQSLTNSLDCDKAWGAGSDFDDCAEGVAAFWGDMNDTKPTDLQLRHADDEVERLYDQYHREQWTIWKSFMDTSWDEINNRPMRKPKQPKRPGRRCSESSPLRKVISAEEVDYDPHDSDSNYATTEGSTVSSSGGSYQSSPTSTNFAWTEYQWEDDEDFASSLSDALGELNCRSPTL